MQHAFSRRRFNAWLTMTGVGAALAAPGARAASEKIPMVRVVTGVPAGSMVDNITRRVAEVIKTDYALNSMVENKTGAGGILALGYLKSQPRDGSSLYVGVSSPLTVYPVTYKKLPYDADKDLVPVGSLGTFDLALAVGPMVPASVTDLRATSSGARKTPRRQALARPARARCCISWAPWPRARPARSSAMWPIAARARR